MKIKKILCIMCLAFALTGCSEDKEQNITDTNEIVQNEVEQNNVIENNETELEQDETKEFSLGEWNGSVYENDFLGLKYTLPQNWIRYSDEEIMALMNLGSELVYGDNDLVKEVSKLTAAYYLFTQNPVNNSNVSVFSEKSILNLTAEEYIEQVKTQLGNVTALKYVIGDESTANIAGEEYVTLEATVENTQMIQKYYVRKEGNYFIGIIVTATAGENEIEEIINCFE